MKVSVLNFIWGQLTQRVPPVIEQNLEGKTVIVTGANIGLGYEAAKHFARMKASRVILACRDQKRGDAAVQKIKEETGNKNVELWILDLAKFASVKSFADRFEKEGGRLDILVENAAVLPKVDGSIDYTSDGWEMVAQVNNLATSLLALLLFPRMLETASKYNTVPRLVVVSSEVHYWTSFESEVVHSGNFFQTYGRSPDYIRGRTTRYEDSKLLNVLFTRALSDRLSTKPIVVDTVNPGYCYSGLRKDFSGMQAVVDRIMEFFLARTTEEGSRQLVWAALAETDDIRGAYVSLAQVSEPSDYVIGEEGKKVQDQLWDNLISELVHIDPRVKEIVNQYLTV